MKPLEDSKPNNNIAMSSHFETSPIDDNHPFLYLGDTSSLTEPSIAEQALELDLISRITQQKPTSSINPEGKLIWPVVDKLENLGAIKPAENSAKLVRMKIDKLAKSFKLTERELSKTADSLIRWPKEIDAPEFEKFSEDMAKLLKCQAAQFEALKVQIEFIATGFKSCSHEEKAKASTLYRINKLTKSLELIRKKHNLSEEYRTVQKDLIDADSTLQRQKFRLRQNANSELRKYYMGYASTLDRSSRAIREACDVFFTNASQIEFDDNLESCNNITLQHHQQKLKMIHNSSKDSFRHLNKSFTIPIDEFALKVRPQQRKNIQKEKAQNYQKDDNLTERFDKMSLNNDNIISKENGTLIIDEEVEEDQGRTERNSNCTFNHQTGIKAGSTMINLSPQKAPSEMKSNQKKLLAEEYNRRNNSYNKEVSVDPEMIWGNTAE